MPGKKQLTVNEFAKFARTTRDTLMHYDRIGLLSPASYGKNRYQYLAPGLRSLGQYRRDLVGGIDPARLDVVVAAVCGFDDQCFQSRKSVIGRIEQPRPLIFRISGERNIMQSVADVEMSYRRSQYMAGVLER